MTLLNSLSPGSNVAVVGAAGGIGAELVSQLDRDARVGQISTFSRTPNRNSGNRVADDYVDITDDASIRRAAEYAAARSPLDLVIVATGLLHRGYRIQPEKSMRDIDSAAMTNVLRVNTVGPALVAKHFLPRLRRDHKTVFAVLSARVGSITDNRLGGWVSYRSSKAALNMVLKTLAIEHARRFPVSVIAALHPGTVNTRLSAPFQRNVPGAKLFTPETAVCHLLTVIDKLTPEDSGGFFAWDGAKIQY